MTGEDPAAYGAAMSSHYDRLYSDSYLQVPAAVKTISDLARSIDGNSILEFGIGTGRLALPLLQEGFTVAGIDASEEMIRKLRQKPRAEEIQVVLGDYSSQKVGSEFAVVVLNFNGIFAPLSREAQIECFRNAARHLMPGGCFVVEAYVLGPDQLGGDWSIWPRSVEKEHVELQLSRRDVGTNRVERTLVHLRPDGTNFVSVFDTYATPGELDLIAQAAGFALRSRSGGWQGEQFTELSRKHITVYETNTSA